MRSTAPRALLDAWIARAPRGILVLDGAMGTELWHRGLPRSVPPDLWVLERPRTVRAVHAAYARAGAHVLLTATFGATHTRLAAAGAAHHTEEINRRAVALARSAAAPSGAMVAGDIGPQGPGAVPAAWAEQARLLAAAGCDLLVLETMTTLAQARAALEAVRPVAPRLPVVVLIAVGSSTGGSPDTLDGVPGAEVARTLTELGADAVGVNCTPPAGCLALVAAMRAGTSRPLAAKPSGPRLSAADLAGAPRGRTRRARLARGSLEAEDWGSEVRPADSEPPDSGLRAPDSYGLSLVGGCCGTTPRTIQFLSRALQ